MNYARPNALKDYSSYLKRKGKMLRELVQRYPISEKSTFLDALDVLLNTVFLKLSI